MQQDIVDQTLSLVKVQLGVEPCERGFGQNNPPKSDCIQRQKEAATGEYEASDRLDIAHGNRMCFRCRLRVVLLGTNLVKRFAPNVPLEFMWLC